MAGISFLSYNYKQFFFVAVWLVDNSESLESQESLELPDSVFLSDEKRRLKTTWKHGIAGIAGIVGIIGIAGIGGIALVIVVGGSMSKNAEEVVAKIEVTIVKIQY